MLGVRYGLSRQHYTVGVGDVEVKMLLEGDGIGRALGRGEAWEQAALAAWHKAVEPGTVVVDAGAYTGLYAALAAALGAFPVAVEPRPQAVARMRANLAAASLEADIRQVALWHVPGHAELYQIEAPLTSGASLVNKSAGPVATRVQLETLDSLLAGDDRRVSAIKIDVEGSELRVIEGATTTINKHTPTILVECMPRSNIQLITRHLPDWRYSGALWLDDRNALLVPR